MDTLPAELHDYICQLACSGDNGFTVRALNSVSKYWNQISSAYLFENVCLSDISRLPSLLDRLRSTPSHLRRMRNLYLADEPVPSPVSAKLSDASTSNRAILSLLTLSAPTLHSLTFVSRQPSSTSIIARLFKISFPNLVDLTLLGYYPFPSSQGNFPRLRHLHLAGNRNPTGLFQTGVLDAACPDLRSLRVTGLGLAVSFVIELKDALRDREVEEKEKEKAAKDAQVGSEHRRNAHRKEEESGPLTRTYFIPRKIPANLRSVVLQADPIPTGRGEIVALKDRLTIDALQALQARETPRVDIIVLDRLETMLTPEDMKRDWSRLRAV